RTEVFLPILAFVEAKGVVERVPRLVPQISHRFVVVFDAQRHLRLDALEARVSEVKRNADQWSVVGAAPLVAEIHGWTKAQSTLIQLLVQSLDQTLDARPPDLEPEIRDPMTKEVLSLLLPIVARHTADSGKRCTPGRLKQSRRLWAPAKTMSRSVQTALVSLSSDV